jgi:6-phospho-beta-glucosidase
MKKLTLIGGGSVRSPFFVHSLAKRAAALGIDRVCLFDKEPRRLELIGAVAAHAAAKITGDLSVLTETDEDRAIRDSAWFVVTIREGGDHSRVIDEEIAAKYGVLGQETTGAGGFFMAARSIPALRGYYEKIRLLAPGAWIFNFTNPSGLVTQAMRSLGYSRVVGICDTPSSTKLRIAQAMGWDNRDFYLEFFGLNHLSWARRALYRGKDVLQEILDREDLPRQVGELAMFDQELLRLLGHIPNEYLYYYYYRDRALANIKNAGTTRGLMVEENNRSLFAALAEPETRKDPEAMLQIYLDYMFKRESSYMRIETSTQVSRAVHETAMPENEGYAGIAMDCIAAMESGKDAHLVLSVPNEGSISGLEDSDVVEVTCKVDSGGPHPVPIGKSCGEMFSLIKAVKTYEQLSAEAIISGNRECAVRALLAHPLIGAYHTARGLVDEFTRQQGEYAGHWR